MKLLLTIYFLFAFVQTDIKLTSFELNEITTKTKKIDIHNVSPDNLNIHKGTKFYLITGNLYLKLFRQKQFSEDTAFILGYFYSTSKNLNILTYRKTYECDHSIDTYELFGITKDGTISEPSPIKYRDDHITLYDVSFKLISNDKIQIIEKWSSDWATLPEAKNDTISEKHSFLNINKIPFDTISVTHKKTVIKL